MLSSLAPRSGYSSQLVSDAKRRNAQASSTSSKKCSSLTAPWRDLPVATVVDLHCMTLRDPLDHCSQRYVLLVFSPSTLRLCSVASSPHRVLLMRSVPLKASISLLISTCISCAKDTLTENAPAERPTCLTALQGDISLLFLQSYQPQRSEAHP